VTFYVLTYLKFESFELWVTLIISAQPSAARGLLVCLLWMKIVIQSYLSSINIITIELLSSMMRCYCYFVHLLHPFSNTRPMTYLSLRGNDVRICLSSKSTSSAWSYGNQFPAVPSARKVVLRWD